ncbi:ABC transporter ATP-binding protein [Streptococcus equi]|uniref:ABC transporter, ATP-binding/permease protein n=1 Tax=Streptococcus equi subsp. equi TaxID=148942 RepID=A0A380JNR2_9STRE|nr:ABC transporter ATP-binding protein [Streptococcus equi]MCD3396876.1 ABC transporter ATP-binding protein/permease [Streptococcus equi subsp. zooepidemicus]MCD3427461.1 ABC transporter ATP-binding protein/permease [Streptococcus equi subsp. zooepidemicus]QTC12006.1 putative ABC transporter ATP-binding protein [Streptococcus equi subsp. zooepidemicus]SUN45830.1 ABC transporter, ATP-binding/permease protein [Streptococcus equi subsp. equi]HEL0016083.1 ABC transporter ATP-binding protein [Strep
MFREMLKLLTKTGKRDLIISSVFFALYGLSSIAMIVIVFSILFQIFDGTSLDMLYKYFIAIGLLVVFKGICNMVADMKKHSAGFDIVQQIREHMIIKLKKFSLGFYTNERLGEINTILHKDVDNMSLVVGHMWSRMFGDFLIGAVVFVGLASIDFKLSIIMAVSVPIALIFLYLTIKQSEKIENQNNSALLDMVSLFVEYVRGIPVLKSFSNNKSLDNELMNKTKKFGETSKVASRFKAKQLSIFGFLLDIGYLVLLIAGAILVTKGSLDVLHFIIFAVISKEFYKPFVSMEQHYMYYISAIDSYERLSRILYADVIPDKVNGIVPKDNDIAFENIDFSYEKDEFKMEKLSFSIAEKTMTALVGESGSGKTTITNLLLRFYDVHKGEITLGGTDIRDIPYDELLDRISIVMQNVQLFDNTIEENIRVGKKGATKEEIIKAAKKARIHDFIMNLPKGYKTDIGENGGILSGGQRQRISIARAFLKDAPILILDEMTSNVDPVNESLIQDAITELAKNRTVLVVAHHLKTIQKADQILVFQKGNLLEKGKHGELLEKDGYYTKLWKAQYEV